MIVSIVTSGIFVAFTLGLWVGYYRGTSQIRNEAIHRKLASWQKQTVWGTCGPVILDKFTWVGEEQDGE